MAKLLNTRQDLANEVKALVELCRAYNDIIRLATTKSPLGGIPSGELYAIVQGKLDLLTHQRVVQLLVDAKQITNTNHLLTYIGK